MTGTVAQDGYEAGTYRWEPNLSLNEFAEKYKDKPRASAHRTMRSETREGTNAHTIDEYTSEGKWISTIIDDTKGGKVVSRKTKDFNPVKKSPPKTVVPESVVENDEIKSQKEDSNPLPIPIIIDTRSKPKTIAKKQYGSVNVVPVSPVKSTRSITTLQNLQKNESLLEKTADARATATIVNTYAAGAADFVQDAHDDILDLKLTQKGIKNVSRFNSVFKVAGRALGVTSMWEHGSKSVDAFKKGDYANAAINGGKVILDFIFMAGKASNPFILFGGIAYTIWDMSGTMQW